MPCKALERKAVHRIGIHTANITKAREQPGGAVQRYCLIVLLSSAGSGAKGGCADGAVFSRGEEGTTGHAYTQNGARQRRPHTSLSCFGNDLLKVGGPNPGIHIKHSSAQYRKIAPSLLYRACNPPASCVHVVFPYYMS